MRRFDFICGIVAAIALAVVGSSSVCAQDRARKTVLAHYMPWYASKPVSGVWGWHWTMDHFNPDQIKADGRREIASHDSPLIGPYDSGDEDALQCQVLLMKFAGLDGVIVDWYGTADFRDYAMVHRNTQRLIVQLKKAGLRFAICYEDQSVKHMIASGRLPKQDEVTEGARAMSWLAEDCFGDPAYVTLGRRPVVLLFGPQHFTKSQLQSIASGHAARPLLFGLPHLTKDAGMDGAFGWPPVTGGREITREVWMDYLKRLDSRENSIAVAFPGFHDIYKEAGLHDSYGFIDDRDGVTFSETMELAQQSRSPIIQIATWNDYGEGTVIEPTVNKGYRYLEVLQRSLAPGSGYTADDLRLPVELYKLKKQVGQNPAQVSQLQRASGLLFAGKCQEARLVLDSLGAALR